MTVTILDGGMGRELLRIGAPFEQPEWSALALMEAPEMVLEAHRNFIAAGADVIITNTYAVVPFHIGEERFAQRGSELVALAGQLARQAADEADRSIRVAGSIPPLFGSYVPDNFRPDLAPAMYRTLVAPQAPFVDFWLPETMSSITEATAAVNAAVTHRRATNQVVWLSFCVPDEPSSGTVVLRSGERIDELVGALADRVDAFLVNCSTPERIDEAIPELVRAVAEVGANNLVGAYANAFEPKQAVLAANSGFSHDRVDLTPDHYADVVDHWVELGAAIVGGCCGIYPDHITELAARHSNEN